MSKVIDGIKYTKDHEWLKKLGNGNYQVGITDYAQNSLGDIVYVDIPDAGTTVKQGQSIGTIESVKAVSDIYAPATGTVVSKNEEIANDPSVVNADPYSAGWFIEVKLDNESDFNGLLSPADYENHLKSL